MKPGIAPSRWVWLALAVIVASVLLYRPSRPNHAPSASVAPGDAIIPAAPSSPAPAAVATPVGQATPVPVTPLLTAVDPTLDATIRATLGNDLPHYAVVVKELRQGTGAMVNADRIFYAASLFKLPVMYEAYRQDAAGLVRLTDELVVTNEAVVEDLGTFDLWWFDVGDSVPVELLVEVMVTASDNTASVLLRDALGRQSIDRTMRSLGLRSTSVSSPDLPTTAGDMALLLEAIVTGRGIPQRASVAMVDLLRQQWVRDRIPAGVPAGIPVGNKTGSWSNAAHDVAVVEAPFGTYLIVVLSDLPGDDATIAALSEQVYAHYAAVAGIP